MMDLAGDNPFADLMSKAVKLKGAQQAQLRTVFDSWPQYFQHSLFMQDSVLSARELPFPERLRAAQGMKASGNAKFAADELEEAVAEYEKALAVFKYVVNTDPGWKKKGIEDVDLRVFDYSCSDRGEEHEDRDDDQRELIALKLSCYLNIAVAKTKLREFAVCIRACDDALELAPDCVKALYRRAQALITPASAGALEFDRAIRDLQRAYDVDPHNRDVCKLLRELKQQRVRQRALDKQTFSGMFERGSVYDAEAAAGGETGEDLEAKAAREIEDAERLAHMFERKGQQGHADEIRQRLAQAKLAQARRLKRVDFFHPTPEMIRDAKENGIDMTDPNVQQMLHDMQEEERTGRGRGSNADGSHPASQATSGDRESVEALLRSMSNAEIIDLLRAEGIDYHKISDREQFFETARQVLLSKLGSHGSKAASPSSSSGSTTRSIMLLAAAWTLMRLYSTGGFTVIGRLLLGMPNATDGESGADEGLFG